MIATIAELRSALAAERRAGRSIGLVPTMGYLHAGHTSLMERSASECDLTVSTIFVNPLQFAPGEDLDSYPRDLEGDREKAEASGTDYLFVPSTREMYPAPALTSVTVRLGVGSMESAARPSHFEGVTTVVAKLFNIVGECRAYFGEKDFQQLVLVRRMASDLSFAVEVVGCATVREPDGLAMSSRNAYLTPEQRAVAPALREALQAGAAAIGEGERSGAVIRELMARQLGSEPLFELDYAETADPRTLERVEELRGEVRLLVAARLGIPRLLDNLGVHVS